MFTNEQQEGNTQFRRGHQPFGEGSGFVLPVDFLSSLEDCVQLLIEKMREKALDVTEACGYQTQLRLNIDAVRRYGDTSENRADRFRILDQLNYLCATNLQQSLLELCPEYSDLSFTMVEDEGDEPPIVWIVIFVLVLICIVALSTLL